MRLQILYPTGQPHEVELLGRVSIVGRDPSCDLVVHDVKCSRRHAVLETGPDGVAVRDSGSANGVFVNGRRVERAILRPGDVIGLGEVRITLMPEPRGAVEATLAPGAGATPLAAPPPRGMAAAPVPPPPPPLPPPLPGAMAGPRPADGPSSSTGAFRLSGVTDSGKLRAAPSEPEPGVTVKDAVARPLTVTVLAALWMASVLLYGISGLVSALAGGGVAGVASALAGVLLALFSALMAVGLWLVKPWARILQIVAAALGTLTCSFTLPSVVALVYMFRAGVRARFAGTGSGDAKEGLFTGLLLGTLALSVLIAAAIGLFATFGMAMLRGTPPEIP